ncbi:sensor histidine kinase [Ornithinibacillus halotolerans]|uniref:histidine kinase n=1 Tax=Ornithinibacillus halotolerans TaxID=1274357 RepID=A0A916S7H9_9BACI|nr:HAMP domain-containing sensor histidine kinase [Ornithinibacillus halotolerans]GGA84478.1 two-component sensor histidine kinase [Ornithinibacillus halotolerans]
MRLQYQLNAAFTLLLLVIMAITGFVIYSLILNLLIQDEQRQLEQKGEILVNVLDDAFISRGNLKEFNEFLKEQDLQLFLYDREQNSVLFSTLPTPVVTGLFMNNDFKNQSEELWSYGNEKYVTSRILIVPKSLGLELILLTPLQDLRIVQHNFIQRLLIVFLIGAIVASGLSYFLTKKLVTPLSRLKLQLKKIEKRNFDEIVPIESSGEINEVAQSVYEMADELQRYINTQRSFFQNASHELKTPLMTIQGYAEGIKEKVFNQQEEEKGLEVIVSEVNRLKKIINEMILLAKLESEEITYHTERIELQNLIDKVIERAIPIATEKNLELKHRIEPNIFIVGDEERLLRAMLNLTFNGIRHGNSTLLITGSLKRGQITITIEDDGEGISEELLPHIFHRFVKGKNGETGLGLAISRAIIEQSNGKIKAENSNLGGAKFTLTFPFKE